MNLLMKLNKTDVHQSNFYTNLLFLKETLLSPREMGACCPSSSELAQRMAQEVDCQQEGMVVELGGGTGTITRALLQHGLHPSKLITIERSVVLASRLRQQFPGIRVIEGDASELEILLGEDIGKINAIVSGLPFRSLPQPCVDAVKQQICRLLDKDGVFVQFSYNLQSSMTLPDPQLVSRRSQIVWKNLPPARVDSFHRDNTVSSI